MTLDLLIINPGARERIYQGLGSELTAIEPPLWCRLIAGYVRDRGFSVQIIDAEAEGLATYEAAERACASSPRLICLAVYGHQPSASTQQMTGASDTAKCIKSRNPNQTVIMVGGHVSALPERTLAEEAIDFAANGEGLATIVGLLKILAPDGAALDFQDIPGLVWYTGGRRSGPIVNNTPAPLIDVKDLHGNAWDLLPMGRYRAHNWQCFGDLSKRQPYAAIYTSLGCPFKCSFCCINAPFGGNRYRMREPDAVVSEILKLHDECGVKTFKIVDEMFVLNERHYTAICQGLINNGAEEMGLNIWAYARVDTVKPHTLAMLCKAGIRWLALGIESGSAHVRDGADKALKSDDIVGVVRAIQDADINVIGNFIVGLPDDTVETMEETYQLAATLNCEFMNVYSAQAYPGSALYAQALKEGYTLPDTWAGFSQHNALSRPLDTRHITAKTVLAFRDGFFRRYYSRPEYISMIMAKFGKDTVSHVESMLKYDITRKLLTGEIL